MRYPFLLLVSALVIGILIGGYIDLPPAYMFVASGVLCVSSIIVWYVFLFLYQNRLPAPGTAYLRIGCVFLLFVGVGMIAKTVTTPPQTDLTAVKTPVRCVVEDIATLTSGDRIIVSIDGRKVVVRCPASSVSPGDIIDLPPKFRKIGTAPNLYQVDYARMMKARGVEYEISVSSDELMPVGRSPHPKYTAYAIRSDIARWMEESPLSHDAKSFLATLYLGEKDLISGDVRKIFSDAGISHLLALSGMHMAIIISIILCLLFPVNLGGLWRWRYFASVVFIWIYTWMTGMAPSTVRAALMATFLFGGILLQRRGNALNSLAAAAFVILLFSPDTVSDIGAQLSFISVAALVVFVNPLNKVSHREHPRLYAAIGVMLTSMIAFAATWPLVSYHFGRLPLLFLPVNLIVLPLLPLYMGSGLLYFVLYSFEVELRPLGYVLDKGCMFLMDFAAWVSGGEKSVLLFEPDTAGIILWCAALAFAAVYFLSNNTKLRRCGLVIAILCGVSSIGLCFVRTTECVTRGIIVQSYLNGINLLRIDGTAQQQVKLPRGKVSELEFNNLKVLTIDCNSDFMAKDYSCKKYHYAIIASGYRGSIEDLKDKIYADTIVLHPTISKRRESQLLDEAGRLGIPAHSLRLDGPIRNITSDKSP